LNTKLIYALVGVVSLLTVVRVEAATVFAPTDGDVNFLFATLGGGTLAMFDDTDLSFEGSSLTINAPEIIGFTGPVNANQDFIATGTNGTLDLIGSDKFILGLNINGNWLADSGAVSLGANAYQVSFSNNGTLVSVDVRVVPAVPVPAAVWLFGSGLLGLVGIARKARVPGMSLS
jgi:hypothetical protein